MSSPDVDPAATPSREFDRLEGSIDRLIAALASARKETAGARAEKDRSDALLREMSEDGQDPAALSVRVAELEAENAELRGRLERGSRRVDRILAGIRFMEDNR